MSDKPRCVCGSENWKGGGSQIGPGYQFSGFICGNCGRYGQEIGREGYYVFLIFSECDAEKAMEYANGPLQIMSRVYHKEWEAIKESRTLEDENKALRLLGLDPDKGCKHEIVRDANGEPVEEPYLDDNGEPKIGCNTKKPMMHTVWEYQDNDGVHLDVDQKALEVALRAAFDKHHKFPGELCAPPLPPQLPKDFDAYLLVTKQHSYQELGDTRPPEDCLYQNTTREWERVDHEASNALEVPPDPRRVAHDAFFEEVFAEVQEKSGLTFVPDVIPSQYENRVAEPWYTFTLLRGNTPVKFLVGPRHRVYSITLSAEEPILKTEAMKFLGDRDDVTYDAEGSWKSEVEMAKEITIHAWGKEKLVEYLIAALHTALGTARVISGHREE